MSCWFISSRRRTSICACERNGRLFLMIFIATYSPSLWSKALTTWRKNSDAWISFAMPRFDSPVQSFLCQSNSRSCSVRATPRLVARHNRDSRHRNHRCSFASPSCANHWCLRSLDYYCVSSSWHSTPEQTRERMALSNDAQRDSHENAE